jgi:hypothetical protein
LADKLLGGVAPFGLLLRYFYFATPQFVYYIIPMAALVSTLVTIGLLTRNSELIVMRACGISLYRSALPLLLFALLFSGTLFELQEHVLASSNREAARLNGIIRGYPMQTFGFINRNGSSVAAMTSTTTSTSIRGRTSSTSSRCFTSTRRPGSWTRSSTREDAALVPRAGADGQPVRMWIARSGWTREFATAKASGRRPERPLVTYTPFSERRFRSSHPRISRPTTLKRIG